MTNDLAIQVQGISKKYCRSLQRTLVYGVKDVARDVFGITSESTELRRDEFWALKDVSFEIKRGECLGLVGANGAGKSTLLKLLNGVILPDTGMIRVHGRVGGLLELGAGFHPMLSGRENIHLSGAILGLSKKEIEDKFGAIVEFSGLKDFIDSPVKYYSSGMYVRLGFAVAVHAKPDIFLVDEALAVGDVLFQAKCFAKIREFKERGATIVLVTHSLDLVTSHCSRALLLDKGRLLSDQSPKAVIDHFNKQVATRDRVLDTSSKKVKAETNLPPSSTETEWKKLFNVNPNEDRYGTKKAEILEAGIFTLTNFPVQILERNQEYFIKVKVRHTEQMPGSIVAYLIKNTKGEILCGTNTIYQNVDVGWMAEGDVIVVTFRQTLRLNPGDYLLCVGSAAYEDGEYVVHDRRYDYMSFQVLSDAPRAGIFDAESTIEWCRTP
jgi:teichoic acid transport system ATP-binding protein